MEKKLKKAYLLILIFCIVLIPTIIIAIDEVLQSRKYNILEEKGYIARIIPETTIEEFSQKFNIDSNRVHVFEGEEEKTDGYIKTGMVASFDEMEEKYKLSTIGDINGDGLMDQIDLNLLIKHVIGFKQGKLEGLKAISADISGNRAIDQIDITTLIRYIMEHELYIPEIERPSAPSIEIKSGEKGENDWYISGVTVEVKQSEDSKVPIGKTIYKITGDKETEPTQINSGEAIEIDEDGEYKITAYSYSTEGARSEIKSITIKIDKEAPTTTAPEAEKTPNAITVTNNQTDDLSGIDEVKYQIKKAGEDWGELQDSNRFTKLTQNAQYEIRTYAKDKAGNESYSEICTVETTSIPELIDDKKAAELGDGTEPNVHIHESHEGWTNEDIVITIELDEDINPNGEYEIEYSKDGGETWEKYNPDEGIVVSENGDIKVRLTDGENAGKEITITIDNIDKEKPTDTAPTATATTNTIKVTNKQTDDLSGIAEVKYQIRKAGEDWGELQNSNEFTGLEADTEYEVRTFVKDKAGNEQYSQIYSLKTKAVPTAKGNITLTPSTEKWTNQNVTVTAKGNTEVENYTIQTKLNNGNWENTSTQIATAYEDVIYVRLTDGANIGEESSITIKNIDKENPIINREWYYGDIDLDGDIDNNDLTKLSKHISGVDTIVNPIAKIQADVNGDGEINSTDLNDLTKYIDKIETNLPASNINLLLGDVDLDGDVDEDDSDTILKFNAGEIQITNEIAKLQADVNGDTIINDKDAMMILQKVNGYVPNFPVLTTYSKNNTIIAKLKALDELSGVGKIIWYYKLQSESNYTKITETDNLSSSHVFKGLRSGIYDIYVEVYDLAGNMKSTKDYGINSIEVKAPSAVNNTTLTPTTREWTNQDVTVTAATNLSGYTVQTKVNDGIWTNNKKPVATAHGDVIYVRLTDGITTGEPTSITINNIDKEKPTKTAPTATSETNDITVTNKQTDELSGIDEVKYQIKRNDETTWGNLQISNKFTELEAGTKYDVRTYVKDKAENEQYSDIYCIKTKQYDNTITVTKNTLTYNSNEQDMVTVKNDQGDVYFNVGTELTSSNYSTIGSTTIPKRKNAGTYTIYWYTPGNKHYKESSGNVEVTINKQVVKAPTGLTVGTDGKVTWTASGNATGYEISIDGEHWTTATNGVNYLNTITATTGNRTVYVRAVNSDTSNYTTPSSNTTKTVTVYSVTLTKGTGVSSVTGAGNYISGATVTLGATVSTGYTWSKWAQTSGGTQVSTINAYSATISGNWAYTANTTANELTFNEATLAEGTYGTAYTSGAFTAASNGSGNYTYIIKSGAPTGSSIDGTNGVNRKIKFTATTPAGTYNVVVTASDTTTGKTKDATFVVKINKQTVNGPTNLAVGTDGKVTWTNASNATGYEISIDGEHWTTATSGVNYLSTITATTGNRTVYVRAVNSDSSNFATSSNATKTVTVYSVALTKGTGISSVTGAGNYISGTTVTLGATVSTGYTWSNWTETSGGTQVSTTLGYSATISGNWAYTANTTANELTFNGATLAEGTYGTAYTSGTFTAASNGSGNYKYTIKSGAPTGASIDGTNGVNRKIKFTATTPAGTYNVVVTASDTTTGKTKDATFVVKINKQTVNGPTNLAVGTDGKVTWTNASNATGYEISIDNSNWTTATSGVNYLNTITATTGNRTVYVRAVNSDSSNFATSSNATKTVTVYSVALTKGTGISSVTGAGNYISGATVTLGATVSTGYTWSKWTETSGGTQVSTTLGYSATISGNWAYTANTTANELTFNGATLAEGTYGTAYTSGAFTAASNGSGNYKYTIKSGAPTGASIDGTNGVNRKIKFTNTTPAGTYNIVVTASDTTTGKTKDATFAVKINKQTVNGPTNLAVGTDGKVTWTASGNATGYEISIDGTNWAAATSGVNYLSTITATAGNRTVYVRGLNSDTSNYTTPSSIVTKTLTVYSVALTKGTGINSVTGAGNYISGATVTLGATVSAGYTWSKWTETSGGTQVSTTNAYSATISGNWAYTANAVGVPYTVNYYNGDNLMGSSTHTYGTEKNLTAVSSLNNKTSPIEEGTFNGWTTSTSETSRTYTDGQSVNNLTTTNNGTITLYAIWQKDTTFYSGIDKETATTSQKLYYNSKGGNYSLEKPTAKSISGWTATGWRTDTTAGAATYNADTNTALTTGDTTYYAVYTRTLTMSYTIDADTLRTTSEQKTQYYNSGEDASNTSNPSFTLAAAPTDTKTDYEFIKWAEGSREGTQHDAGTSYTWNPSVTDESTKNFYSIWRRLASRQIVQVRYENADGTWGDYSNVIDEDYDYGSTVEWSRAADETYQAASITPYTATEAKTTQVSVYRNTFTQIIQYRNQKADGNYEGYTQVVNGAYRYGQTCSWAGLNASSDGCYKAVASQSYTVTAAKTTSLNRDRNTYTFVIQYRNQKADGNYDGYTEVVNSPFRYGATATWNGIGSDATYKAIGKQSFTVTKADTKSFNRDRNTFTVTCQYRFQNADGSYPSTWTNGNSGTYRYGQTHNGWSRNADDTYNAASIGSFTVTGAVTKNIDVSRKSQGTITATIDGPDIAYAAGSR